MSLNRNEAPKPRIHEREMVTIFERNHELEGEESIYAEKLYFEWILKNPEQWRKMLDFRRRDD